MLAATAADNNTVAGVQFKVDGTNVGTEDTTSPYGVTWNSTAASEGQHSITAVARDNAGQITTSNPVNVTVDNVPDTTGTVEKRVMPAVTTPSRHPVPLRCSTAPTWNW